MSANEKLDGGHSKIDYSEAVSQIEGKSRDELTRLLESDSLDDESELGSYLQALPEIKRLNDKKDKLNNKNKEIAEYNLSQKPIIYDKRLVLLKKQEEASEYIEAIKNTTIEIAAKSGNCNPYELHALLQIATMEAEDKSNQLLDGFMERERVNSKDTDKFLEDFVQVRKMFHLRHIKFRNCKEMRGMKSPGPTFLYLDKKDLLPTPRRRVSKSSSPKRRAPLPPEWIQGSHNSTAVNVKPSKLLSPSRVAPPPPRAQSASPKSHRNTTWYENTIDNTNTDNAFVF